MKLIFILLIIFSARARAADPDWKGLPETLPFNYVETKGFVQYQSVIPMDGDVPMPRFRAYRVNTNGTQTEIQPPESFNTVFQDHWVMIPAGQKIENAKDAKGNEKWIYPKSMELVHRFMFAGGKIFQLRLMRKGAGATWMFGDYEPDPTGHMLVLLKNLTSDPRKFDNRDAHFGSVRINFDLIPSTLCAFCHGEGNSDNSIQPCAFGPDLKDVKDRWNIFSKYFADRRTTHRGTASTSEKTPEKISEKTKYKPKNAIPK